MTSRRLSVIAGVSYLIIFFSAIFANFFVLEALIEAPLINVRENRMIVGLGIIAFLITVVFDVIVAWALLSLFENHPLARLSTYFRMIHAAVMAVAIFALPMALNAAESVEILRMVDIFNTIWLIGLFFFGIHLILLARILAKPRSITIFLVLAGIMYMVDTCAHVVLFNYDQYASTFLLLVAVLSIIGEMSLAIWLLVRGGKVELVITTGSIELDH